MAPCLTPLTRIKKKTGKNRMLGAFLTGYGLAILVMGLLLWRCGERREWQDVSTAPKDGTRILAQTASGYVLIVGWAVHDGYWRHRVDSEHHWEVVRWMPLP